MKVNPYEAVTGGQSRRSKLAVEKASLDDSNDVTSAQHKSFKEQLLCAHCLAERDAVYWTR